MTQKEQEILLLLFKDFNSQYNANTLSKKTDISRQGAIKILKNLKKQELVVSKQYGKAVFYKVNLNGEYARQVVKTLLMKEVLEKAGRWLYDLKNLFEHTKIVIIFGSAVYNYSKAKDVDLLVVFEQKKMKTVKDIVANENKILMKPIHMVMQSPNDFAVNMKKPDPVIINALRFGYVLYGYDKLINTVREVQIL